MIFRRCEHHTGSCFDRGSEILGPGVPSRHPRKGKMEFGRIDDIDPADLQALQFVYHKRHSLRSEIL